MSCLFNSLQHFLPPDSNQTRQAICDYLEANQPIIDGISTRVILNLENPNYIPLMRHGSTWGGAIEIQAACNIWNTSVVVHDIRRVNQDGKDVAIQFIPVKSTYNKEIHINWNGGHYTPRLN